MHPIASSTACLQAKDILDTVGAIYSMMVLEDTSRVELCAQRRLWSVPEMHDFMPRLSNHGSRTIM
eukprot:2826485-Pleurochrysis_carterae.AAC.1